MLCGNKQLAACTDLPGSMVGEGSGSLESSGPIATRAPTVEVVDSRHRQWRPVLDLIEKLGQRDALQLDDDGWLPARQGVVAAFIDGEPAGHLVFHLRPVSNRNVAAQVDALGVRPGMDRDMVSRALHAAAVKHARVMHVRNPDQLA
jgi:hypothetical protein